MYVCMHVYMYVCMYVCMYVIVCVSLVLNEHVTLRECTVRRWSCIYSQCYSSDQQPQDCVLQHTKLALPDEAPAEEGRKQKRWWLRLATVNIDWNSCFTRVRQTAHITLLSGTHKVVLFHHRGELLGKGYFVAPSIRATYINQSLSVKPDDGVCKCTQAHCGHICGWVV